MIYCMADIHGAYDRYLAMLQAIQFCDGDTLYGLAMRSTADIRA